MKLTPQVLYSLGFNGQGKDIINNPCYRLKIPGYYYDLQVVLGDYPESNPNCGIVSLYSPELKDMHCITSEKEVPGKKPTRVDFVQWKIDGQVGGIKYITIKEKVIPIAWYVVTLDQLNLIYTSLTKNEPLKLRP